MSNEKDLEMFDAFMETYDYLVDSDMDPDEDAHHLRALKWAADFIKNALDSHDVDKFLFDKLLSHVGHHIECVWYGNEETGIVNVSVECEDCGEVLFDIDNPEFEQEE